MAGYTDMHNSVLKSKAAASKKEEDKKAAEEAEKRTKADEAAKTAPVAVKKQEEQTKKVADPVEEKEVETYVENSAEGVANAKVGDKLKRRDGTVVTITQADIDDAKAEISPKEPEVKTDANGLEVKENNDDALFQDDMIKSETEMSEESKQATKELALKFNIPTGENATPEALNDFVNSGEADAAKQEITAEVTDKDGNPLDEETFKTSIFPSERPEDAMNWFQKWAPALTVLSLVVTSIGLAAGVPIVPINFNKISNRDEAYQAYTEIMVADQNQKNADTNMLATPMQAYETKKAFDEKYGEGAYKEGAETQGLAAEAGNIAVNKQQNEFSFDMSDKEQQNALEQLEKSGELEIKRMEVEQRFALENMSEENKNQLALMYAQAETNAEMAQLVNELETSFDARSIEALQNAKGPDGKPLTVNDYARWKKAQSGRTAADTVNDYLNTTVNAAGTAIDAINPLK